jgi:uncharacterized BrkB/YihY/UPF0761 family membrane protein
MGFGNVETLARYLIPPIIPVIALPFVGALLSLAVPFGLRRWKFYRSALVAAVGILLAGVVIIFILPRFEQETYEPIVEITPERAQNN